MGPRRHQRRGRSAHVRVALQRGRTLRHGLGERAESRERSSPETRRVLLLHLSPSDDPPPNDPQPHLT